MEPAAEDTAHSDPMSSTSDAVSQAASSAFQMSSQKYTSLQMAGTTGSASKYKHHTLSKPSVSVRKKSHEHHDRVEGRTPSPAAYSPTSHTSAAFDAPSFTSQSRKAYDYTGEDAVTGPTYMISESEVLDGPAFSLSGKIRYDLKNASSSDNAVGLSHHNVGSDEPAVSFGSGEKRRLDVASSVPGAAAYSPRPVTHVPAFSMSGPSQMSVHDVAHSGPGPGEHYNDTQRTTIRDGPSFSLGTARSNAHVLEESTSAGPAKEHETFGKSACCFSISGKPQSCSETEEGGEGATMLSHQTICTSASFTMAPKNGSTAEETSLPGPSSAHMPMNSTGNAPSIRGRDDKCTDDGCIYPGPCYNVRATFDAPAPSLKAKPKKLQKETDDGKVGPGMYNIRTQGAEGPSFSVRGKPKRRDDVAGSDDAGMTHRSLSEGPAYTLGTPHRHLEKSIGAKEVGAGQDMYEEDFGKNAAAFSIRGKPKQERKEDIEEDAPVQHCSIEYESQGPAFSVTGRRRSEDSESLHNAVDGPLSTHREMEVDMPSWTVRGKAQSSRIESEVSQPGPSKARPYGSEGPAFTLGAKPADVKRETQTAGLEASHGDLFGSDSLQYSLSALDRPARTLQAPQLVPGAHGIDPSQYAPATDVKGTGSNTSFLLSKNEKRRECLPASGENERVQGRLRSKGQIAKATATGYASQEGEQIYRHLEPSKAPGRGAYMGKRLERERAWNRSKDAPGSRMYKSEPSVVEAEAKKTPPKQQSRELQAIQRHLERAAGLQGYS